MDTTGDTNTAENLQNMAQPEVSAPLDTVAPVFDSAAISEEAKAEEEFVADIEETIKNPLIPEEQKEDDALTGAVGSGNFDSGMAGEPFNNELALKEEVMEGNNPFGAAPAAGDQSQGTIGGEMPAVNPAPAPVAENPTPVAAPVAGGEVKKKKTGLIIGIIVAAVILIGGGVAAVLAYTMHEKPERYMEDALSKLLSSEALQYNGKITVTPKDANGLEKVVVDLSGNAKGADTMNEGKFTLTLEGGKDINLGIGMAYAKGGTLYFKVSGLKSITEILTEELGSMDGADIISTLLNGVIEKLDGNWYKLVASDLGENASQYSCVTEKLDKIASTDDSEKVKEAYKNNPFLTYEETETKDGIKYFDVKVDEAKSEAFGKEVSKFGEVEEISKCFETDHVNIDDEWDIEFDEEDSDVKVESKAKKPTVTFGIKTWSHELVEVGIKYSDDDTSMSGTISLGYEDRKADIPSEAKGISSIEEDLMSGLQDSLKKVAEEQCKAYEGTENYDLCVDAIMDAFDTSMFEDMDLEDVLNLGLI